MLAKFIGVYSGRVQTDQPYEAQIGLVCDASFIDEIIAANNPADIGEGGYYKSGGSCVPRATTAECSVRKRRGAQCPQRVDEGRIVLHENVGQLETISASRRWPK